MHYFTASVYHPWMAEIDINMFNLSKYALPFYLVNLLHSDWRRLHHQTSKTLASPPFIKRCHLPQDNFPFLPTWTSPSMDTAFTASFCSGESGSSSTLLLHPPKTTGLLLRRTSSGPRPSPSFTIFTTARDPWGKGVLFLHKMISYEIMSVVSISPPL